MKKHLIVFTVLVLFGSTSCMHEHHPAADRQALIQMTTEDWDANVLAGNMEACVDSYTEDAVRIQDGMIYSGKEEIRSLLTSEIRPGFTVSTSENTLEDIRISGNLATVRGTFLGSWAHAEWGDTLWTKAAWVDICERQADGSWKMVFTMATELME